jgi:hypothetical protein
MKCALCLNDRSLCDSHIIPEFVYESLYDEKHRFHVVSAEPDERARYKQKGLKESLLCEQCETQFSKHESYAKSVLKGGVALNARREGSLIVLSGLNYHAFKLFQLSILWRAGVSKSEFFQKVQLGPHEEVLRTKLLNNDPGTSTAYGCVMWGITMLPGESPALIMQPTRTRIHGHVTYKFMFGGLVWVFFVTSQEIAYPFNQCIVKENGETVVQVKHISEMHDLAAFMATANKHGNLPRSGA